MVRLPAQGREICKAHFESGRAMQYGSGCLFTRILTAKWPMMELHAFYMAQSSTRLELILFPAFYMLQPGNLSDTSKLHAWEEEWKKHQKEDNSEPGRIDIESWRRVVRHLRGIIKWSKIFRFWGI